MTFSVCQEIYLCSNNPVQESNQTVVSVSREGTDKVKFTCSGVACSKLFGCLRDQGEEEWHYL